MNDTKIKQFRTLLSEMRQGILMQDDISHDSQKTVLLDQQSVGRLSRMDAMQQQAMAKATQARRGQQLLRIEAAFARIDDGEYGYCAQCGEDIPLKRLELDPTLATCVTCAAD
ncbi:TraR/DksA family transcriptional regulator [Profundibacter sp.]